MSPAPEVPKKYGPSKPVVVQMADDVLSLSAEASRPWPRPLTFAVGDGLYGVRVRYVELPTFHLIWYRYGDSNPGSMVENHVS